MLASLTGLLLTLGGDQPAVVFDPPLDPAIFDWDGTTLKVRPEFLPLELVPGSIAAVHHKPEDDYQQTSDVQTTTSRDLILHQDHLN